MNTSRWIVMDTDADLTLMSKVLGISQITANVMANRGLRTKKTAYNFLMPAMEKMHDVSTMKGVLEAIELIGQAVQAGKKIVVYGDYDVDGIMSTVILHKALSRAGAIVDYYIPHRINEGYGPNIAAILRLHETGAQLLITVDNGISAIDEIATAVKLGMEVIVVDHHDPGFDYTDDKQVRVDILPPATVIIDPKQSDCPYPFKELCAAGLSYKLAAAMGLDDDELLALAAIATICDIVELQDENRVLVREGLTRLNAQKHINSGLGSLITHRGYLDKPIDTFTVGFVIGPCLNSAGRLESANEAVSLLLTQSPDERKRISNKLCELNDTRKKLTADCINRVMINLSDTLDKILVLSDPQAHESIAGIVAGRIKEITGRPTIVLTPGDSGMKGSGRSIEGYNLFEALFEHKHLFTRFGGHPMAAGLSIPTENVETLKVALNADCTLVDDDFTAMYKIDRELNITDITMPLSSELAALAPFGKGNREPLFVSRKMFVQSCRVIDEKNTLIFTFKTPSGRLKGIAFGLNAAYAAAITKASLKPEGGFYIDAVYTIETNVYNGVASVQARLVDFKNFTS